MRYAAGAKKLISELGKILPQTGTEWALRLGPEAGFAAIGAFMAPEGSSLGDRLGLAAEDMLIGTGSSFLGSGLGRLGGKAVYGKRAAELGDEVYQQKLANAMTAGDILAAPLPMFAPRPIASSVYERAMEQQNQQQQEAMLQQEQERMLQEALLGSVLTGGGSLLAPGSASLYS
jgi:hypothetical protein